MQLPAASGCCEQDVAAKGGKAILIDAFPRQRGEVGMAGRDALTELCKEGMLSLAFDHEVGERLAAADTLI